MPAELLPYSHVPAGFEMVIENNEAKAWGSWFNVVLSDDPDKWDDDIRHLNALQQGLGTPSDGQRLVRAHMAEFCRRQPLFPESMAILCREVGAGALKGEPETLPLVGCEGRGLLPSLGYGGAEARSAQWQASVRAYAPAIAGWRLDQPPETPIERRVQGFLGPLSAGKIDRLETLVVALDDDDLAREALRVASRECSHACRGEEPFDGHPHPIYCLDCDDWSAEQPGCGCAPARVLDAALLAAGPWEDAAEMGTIFRRFIEEYVLAYALGINVWLERSEWTQDAWPEGTRFVTADDAAAIGVQVGEWLGAPDDETKEWLAACLLKTITGNQRWRERVELIDGVPKATSWLRNSNTG